MTFREVQVQDVLDVQWGDTKTTKSSYVDDGYLAYSATGPDGFLPKFDYDCEGVVLSAIGANCGATFFATNKWSCIKNTIRILPRSSDIDLKYFYFMTKSPNFWPLRGSAQSFISQTDIREMVIKIPDLATQKQIGEVIYRLELSIEKNGQIAETLEEIAQAIFKSWFIDFDPVKAKMAGEKPVGMDDATAALFPDSMEETDSGLIPKGWKYSLIENFAHVRYGAPFASKLFNDIGDGKPLIRIRDLRTQRIATWSAENHTKGFTVNGGQLLIGMDGEFNPTLWRGEEALVNQRICLLENKPGVSSLFLYFSLIPIMKRIENGAIGTTVIHLGKGDIDEICLLNPGTELLNIFEGLMKELLQEMVSLESQSRNLLAIRDSLLPRLISGELKIPEEMLAS